MSFSFLCLVLEESEYSLPFAQVEMMLREVLVLEKDHDHQSRHHYLCLAEKGDP